VPNPPEIVAPDTRVPPKQPPQHVSSRRLNASLRIPIRWRWSILVGLTVTLSVLVLFFITLDIEHDAWLDNQAAQAALQVDRLADSLKLPLLSGSSTETAIAAQGFLDHVPAVLGIVIQFPDHTIKSFGATTPDPALEHALPASNRVTRLPLHTLWFGKRIVFDKTAVGTLAVHYSEQQWETIASQLRHKILLAAVFSIGFSGLLVFWIAGRMSRPIEMLGDAARRVAGGDYHIDLPVHGNDELADTLSQFNTMASELAHKAALRDVFGRYLNPQLIHDVFEGGDVAMDSHRQEVSVLFADMVHFTSFSESTTTEAVVTLLNRHFEIFHRVISYYNGHVDKYIGDAVMAVFNHPVVDAAHPRQAALAGLAMAAACQQLNDKRPDGTAIRFRFGLNSGTTIVGNIGAARRLEYTVIGDAVNVASRMAGMGPGGALIMSRDTYALLGDGFAFHSLGMHPIKGIRTDIEIGHVVATDVALQHDMEHVVNLALQTQWPEPCVPTDTRQGAAGR